MKPSDENGGTSKRAQNERDNAAVDNALRELFKPILEEPVPPKISALLSRLVENKAR